MIKFFYDYPYPLSLSQEPSKFTGSYAHDRFPDATECAMAVAFKGASSTDPDSIPLMVMQTMLGVCVCACMCVSEWVCVFVRVCV